MGRKTSSSSLAACAFRGMKSLEMALLLVVILTISEFAFCDVCPGKLVLGKCYYEDDDQHATMSFNQCKDHCETRNMSMACPITVQGYHEFLKEFNHPTEKGDIWLANAASEPGECLRTNNWIMNNPDCRINIHEGACDMNMRCLCQADTATCMATRNDIFPGLDATFPDCPDFMFKTHYNANSCGSADDVVVIEALKTAFCHEDDETSFVFLCTGSEVHLDRYESADCSGWPSRTVYNSSTCYPSDSEDPNDMSRRMYSCTPPTVPGEWWILAGFAGAGTCNGQYRLAYKSGWCRRENDGTFATADCGDDGEYTNKEECDAGCSTCAKTENLPAISCQTGLPDSDYAMDIRCSSNIANDLTSPRPPPVDGFECPAGGLLPGGGGCAPSCNKKEEVANCLAVVAEAFADLPDDMLGCAWIDAVGDHAARCFGSHGCCADWGAAVTYWKRLPGVEYENCNFPHACIEGCVAEEGGEEGSGVFGPCVGGCEEGTLECIDTVSSGSGDTCADIAAIGPAVAECFAEGDCCDDMTVSVALWQQLVLFSNCPMGTFPTECKLIDNKVSMSVTLPIASKEEFTESKQTQYRQGVADAAEVELGAVFIKKIAEVDVRRRQLLAKALQVDTDIILADKAAVEALVSSDKLSETNLQMNIAAAGLSEVPTLAKAAEAVIQTENQTENQSTPPPNAGWRAAPQAVFAVMGVALALAPACVAALV